MTATIATNTYLLSNNRDEQERLRVQARAWEGETETMLDQIGIQPGWRCLDIGCGAMGILGPLSRRVGIDNALEQLVAARAYVEEEGLDNAELLERNAYGSELPDSSFDLVHVRFLLAPGGHDDALLREMIRLYAPAACWRSRSRTPASGTTFRATRPGFG
jgi:ubiquinone/menaquinone biosynthesis C-methylase UbiE